MYGNKDDYYVAKLFGIKAKCMENSKLERVRVKNKTSLVNIRTK